jgi:hypothetical protein
MPERQFDVYVDGERLPAWFLRDEQTQLGARSAFNFDDSVVRYDAPRDADLEPLDARDEFVRPNPPGPDDLPRPFAHLNGRALRFTLRRSEETWGVAVAVTCSADLRLYCPRTFQHVARFGLHEAPLVLPWSHAYYIDGEHDDSWMLLEVRRVPLREMGAALNRR